MRKNGAAQAYGLQSPGGAATPAYTPDKHKQRRRLQKEQPPKRDAPLHLRRHPRHTRTEPCTEGNGLDSEHLSTRAVTDIAPSTTTARTNNPAAARGASTETGQRAAPARAQARGVQTNT